MLERANGEPTYFASDCAYLLDKQARGFERQIDVFGADHHGYVARLRGAFQALGGEPDTIEILIMQFVHLIDRGERSAMSKRRGIFNTLDELIDDIGVDATRFFMLQRSHDTTVDLDLDLRARAVEREPRLLRAVRARADPLDAGEGGRGARRRRRSWRRRGRAAGRAAASRPSVR